MTIEARPAHVAVDANALVVVVGPPNVPIYWGAIGNAIVHPLHVRTNAFGAAAARVTPTGVPGDVITVSANYGI